MNPLVAILLCTYQGEKYLAAQLDSFTAQSHPEWKLWVSDDGSTDSTLKQLAAFAQQHSPGQVTIQAGPRKGFVKNFMSLICHPALHADYYALSDQDDIWHPDKLERAVKWLSQVPETQPALYCTRTELIDEAGRSIGFSPLFTRPPAFGNALMQNVAGGNTMVMNNTARALLLEVGANIDVVAHDWWVYIAISACGGRVYYDPEPSLRYRQHDGNLIGANASLGARLLRVQMLFQGHLKTWTDQHIYALRPLMPKLPPANRRMYDSFVSARQRSLLPRVIGIKRSGVYRQTHLGNLGLLAAAVSNRI